MPLMLNGKVLTGVEATAEFYAVINDLEKNELVSVDRLIYALHYAAHRLEVAADLVESRKYGTAFVVIQAACHYLKPVAAVFAGDDPRKLKE